MKKVLVILLVAFSFIAEGQVVTPAPSTAATVSTVVGLTDVKVEYSRPKGKGRKIFGEGASFVTPYGQMWRTGANNGSKVTFSDDVKFGGMDVPKGTYLLLTIPGASDWTVILYKDVAMGGNTGAYDQAKDQARVSVKSEKLTEKVESFTIGISDLSENSKTANLQISWENTSVKVPITVDFDAKVMSAIANNIPDNLFAAATYYYENGKDMKKALAWVNEAIASNPKAFWMTLQKAKIQKALGDKKGAMETSMLSKATAQEAKNDQYVKMNDELMATLK
ncbi:DUF2911 domain-containing protein [soil metagenome]